MTARAAPRLAGQAYAADMAHCRDAIRHGSLSFHAASRLLPSRVRDPALALYAFCRLADDAVDLSDDPGGAVLRLGERLDAVYAGTPRNAPADRAFAAVVEAHGMPRALPDALIEGLAWDALGREYRTLGELHDYAARVAGAVGAMMCVLMDVRDRHALARACDLGAAMQLTNIARDVGEDAALGRVYLPLDWLEEAGLDRAAFVARPARDARGARHGAAAPGRGPAPLPALGGGDRGPAAGRAARHLGGAPRLCRDRRRGRARGP